MIAAGAAAHLLYDVSFMTPQEIVTEIYKDMIMKRDT
jgi:hypothetical protein